MFTDKRFPEINPQTLIKEFKIPKFKVRKSFFKTILIFLLKLELLCLDFECSLLSVNRKTQKSNLGIIV